MKEYERDSNARVVGLEKSKMRRGYDSYFRGRLRAATQMADIWDEDEESAA